MSPAAKQCKSRAAVLKALADGKINEQEASERLDQVEPKNGNGRHVTMKVSEKGAITFRQVPGTSAKFGMTLYVETVEWLYANDKQVKEFIKDNNGSLSRKNSQPAE